MNIERIVRGYNILSGGSVSSGLPWYLSIVSAMLLYFFYSETRLINVPSEILLPSYDFIVIGGGSAGCFIFLYNFK